MPAFAHGKTEALFTRTDGFEGKPLASPPCLLFSSRMRWRDSSPHWARMTERLRMEADIATRPAQTLPNTERRSRQRTALDNRRRGVRQVELHYQELRSLPDSRTSISEITRHPIGQEGGERTPFHSGECTINEDDRDGHDKFSFRPLGIPPSSTTSPPPPSP